MSPRRLSAAIVVAALFAPGLLPAIASAGKATLRVRGVLPEPEASSTVGGTIVQIDPVAQRAYYIYVNRTGDNLHYLGEFDLRHDVPTLVRTGRIGSLGGWQSPYTVALDTRRGRLLALNYPVGGTSIQLVDLASFESNEAWDLVRKIPGFVAFGLSYSPDEDLLYLVGEVGGHYSFASGWLTGRKAAGPGTSVVALRPDAGDVAWVRPVPQCQQVLNSINVGSLIVRGPDRPTLMFACVTGGSGQGDSFPGQAGLVQLTVSANASQADALQFPLEFFPISGAYFNGCCTGIAGYDRRADRFFLQSLSRTTPGAWVFDGRLSAWVGFVAAPDNRNNYLGISESLGRYYMASNSPGDPDGGYLIAVNGRQTPVPQGSLFPFTVHGFIPTDPGSNRLFIRVDLGVVGRGPAGTFRYLVLEDAIPPADTDRAVDYDANTTNLEESAMTVATFAGTVSGFGSRAFLVGGYGGALSPATGPFNQPPTLPGMAPGDRGVMAARVNSLDLRNVGASAAAQALTPDSLTADEWRTREEEIRRRAGDDAAEAATWPWAPAACVTGSEDARGDEQSGNTGSAEVGCGTREGRATALASFGDQEIGPISLGSARFEGEVTRDPRRGTVTRAVALAEDLQVDLPGIGSLTIGRIVAEAETAAHGRPRTSQALLTRRMEGILLRAPTGDPILQLGRCEDDECAIPIPTINDVLGTKLRIDIPSAERIATPGGAFAGIQKPDAAHFNDLNTSNDKLRAVPAIQITIFNDSVEKSRLVLQFAAIQASSIYGISLLPQVASSQTGGSSSLVGPQPPVPRRPEILEVDPSRLPEPPRPVLERLVQGGLFLLRSPKEALLVATLWILFSAPAWAAWRRRSLSRVLLEDPVP